MTKFSQTFVLGALFLGLSGCFNSSSPRAILGTAYHALEKSDSKTFVRTLTGAAKEKYGNLAGMAALQTELAGRKLTLGETNLLRVERNKRGEDTLRVYTAVVITADRLQEVFKLATVDCKVTYTRVGSYHPCRGRPDPACDSGNGFPSYWQEDLSCRISNLE